MECSGGIKKMMSLGDTIHHNKTKEEDGKKWHVLEVNTIVTASSRVGSRGASHVTGRQRQRAFPIYSTLDI